jgi:hypothetical protein
MLLFSSCEVLPVRPAVKSTSWRTHALSTWGTPARAAKSTFKERRTRVVKPEFSQHMQFYDNLYMPLGHRYDIQMADGWRVKIMT